MTLAAEQARQASLRQEQEYMAFPQESEPYAEVIDDHVEKRLTEIPAEMAKKPPM